MGYVVTFAVLYQGYNMVFTINGRWIFRYFLSDIRYDLDIRFKILKNWKFSRKITIITHYNLF